jgi:protein-disulfide isomerase
LTPIICSLARLAAEAAEAAGLQGKFWDMHEMLYARQSHLDFVALTEYAEAIGLDTDRFRDDLESHACVGKVAEDFISGVRSGVNGTPSFFINGRRHLGPWDFNNLLAAPEHAATARKAA